MKCGCSKLVLGDSNNANLAKVEKECRALADSSLHILSKKCDTRVPDEVDQIIAFAINGFGEINYCANCGRLSAYEGNTIDISLADFTRPGEVWQRGVRTPLSLGAELYCTSILFSSGPNCE